MAVKNKNYLLVKESMGMCSQLSWASTVHTRLEKHGKAPVPAPATEQPLQYALHISVAINFCEVQDPGSGGLHQQAIVLPTSCWFGYCMGHKGSQAVVSQAQPLIYLLWAVLIVRDLIWF